MERPTLVIQKCRDHGIKLSIQTFEIGHTVKFAGFTVSSEGTKPDPAKLTALRSFPSPKSVTDLRSFLGLANQLGAFIPDLQHCSVKIRDLLKNSSAWLWLPEHKEEFNTTPNRRFTITRTRICSHPKGTIVGGQVENSLNPMWFMGTITSIEKLRGD